MPIEPMFGLKACDYGGIQQQWVLSLAVIKVSTYNVDKHTNDVLHLFWLHSMGVGASKHTKPANKNISNQDYCNQIVFQPGLIVTPQPGLIATNLQTTTSTRIKMQLTVKEMTIFLTATLERVSEPLNRLSL